MARYPNKKYKRKVEDFLLVETELMTREEVGYIFNVGPSAVERWERLGRLIAAPDAGRRRYHANEVRRLYEEVGGMPEGGWRQWARLPRKGQRQAR
jgi:hypothetical protein